MKHIAVALALLLVGCHAWIFHPVDSSTWGWDHRSKAPQVMIYLGQNQQMCLEGKKETHEVDIFVQLRNLPAQAIQIEIDHSVLVNNLFGTAVEVHVAAAGQGHHEIRVFVPGFRKEPFTSSFGVYACPPEVKDPLSEYHPEIGVMLKGYCTCPDPEPCTTPQ